MNKHIRNHRDPESHCPQRRGAVAVEMALITPVIAVLVFGAIEVGQFIYASQSVGNASREGARKATRFEVQHVDEVENAVTRYLDEYGEIPASAIQVIVSNQNGAQISGSQLAAIESGSELTVTVNVQFSAVRSFYFLNLFQSNQISNSTVMRKE